MYDMLRVKEIGLRHQSKCHDIMLEHCFNNEKFDSLNLVPEVFFN